METPDQLRVRVHGLTAAKPGPKPKAWDESRVPGWNRKFSEDAVKRDTDPGEEGQFDFKPLSKEQRAKNKKKAGGGGGGGGGSGKSKAAGDAERAAKKAETALKNAKATMVIGPPKSVAARQSLIAKAIRNDWPYEQNDDGSGVVHTPAGDILLGSDSELPDSDVNKRARESESARKKAEAEAKKAEAERKRGVSRQARKSQQIAERRNADIIKGLTSSLDARKDAAIRGFSLPDGSYPITSIDDLDKALTAAANDPREVVHQHIAKRAAMLGVDLL